MENISVLVALFLAGAGFIFLALIGGSVRRIRGSEVQPLSNGIRIASSIVGVIFVIGGFLYEDFPSPVPEPKISITGRVVDIFDNPRDDVIVIIRGIQQYAITDNDGKYYLSDVPFQNNITLEAYYGNEKDDINVNLSRYDPGEVVSSPKPLILKPIKVEAFFAKDVIYIEGKGFTPEGIFEEESPRISLNQLPFDKEERHREVWCFVKVIGPPKYEVGKEMELSYEWYYNNEIQDRPFKQQVGVSPLGWRTRVSKKVWVGEWSLKIKTKHEELVIIHFEIL